MQNFSQKNKNNMKKISPTKNWMIYEVFTKEIKKMQSSSWLDDKQFSLKRKCSRFMSAERNKRKNYPKRDEKMLALNSTISPMPHKRVYEKEKSDDKNCKRHTREIEATWQKKKIFPSRFTFDFSISLNERIGKRGIRPRGKFVLISFTYHPRHSHSSQ